jgi:hypothetical protein
VSDLPWEDFKPPQGVDPAVAGVQTQPWEDFSAAHPAPKAGPKDFKEFQKGLGTLLQSGAPVADVYKYAGDSGYSLDQGTKKWIDTQYGDFIKKHPGSQFDVRQMQPAGEIPGLGEAAALGFNSALLPGWDDNAAGGLAALEGQGSYGDLSAEYRRRRNQAWEDNPVEYATGYIPGLAAGMLTGGTEYNMLNKLGKMGDMALRAALWGGASGSGNADEGTGSQGPSLMDRVEGGAKGAVTSALLSPLMLPVTALGRAVGSRIGEYVRKPNSLNSGLDILSSRAPQKAEDMAARAAEMRAAGVDPRLVDVVDESGRGVVRAAANKMTPARQELADHANKVYVDAQDRVAEQARRNISKAPKTARQYGEDIKAEQDAMGPQFDAVRNNPVTVTGPILDAFSTAEGRSALRSVSRWMTPAEQVGLNKFAAAIKQVATLDPRLPAAVRKQIADKIMQDAPLTVDVADKFSRLLTKQAADKPAMMRVATKYSDLVRGAARTQYGEYDKALTDFKNTANVGNAAEGTRGFENTDFMKTPPDQFRPGAASSTPAAVADPTGAPTLSEQDAVRIRARDQVVDKATEGAGQNALGVARQIERGSAQHERNVALLGEEGAQKLESGMRNEVRRVDNTRYIDPRVGSKTAPMREDDAAVNEGIHFAADAASHGKWGLIRGTSRWLRGAGIRGVDAERLTRDAISGDQSRVNAAIDYLAQKGVDRSRARSLVRSLTAAYAGRVGGAGTQGIENPHPAPNSVRAILREGGRQ